MVSLLQRNRLLFRQVVVCGGLLLAKTGLFAPAAMSAQSDPANPIATIVRSAGRAVVVLRTYDAQGQPIALGSGFITRDGRVVTNAHVLAGAATVEVVDTEGQLLLTAQFAEALSARFDVAVLPRVSTVPATLSLAKVVPSPGDRILVIGAPEGLTNTISDGIVSSVRRLSARTLLQITAPISPGSSGGPVLNLRGEVVGISLATLTDGQNLNFAVPVADVRAMIASPPGRFNFPPATESELAARADERSRPLVHPPVSPSGPPLNPAELRAALFALPAKQTEQREGIEFRFLGCFPLPGGTEVGCFLRVANISGSGRTRVFTDFPSLNDENGMGGRLTEIVHLTTGESDHLPMMRNISPGSDDLVSFGFVGFPASSKGAVFRVRVSPGWTAKRYKLVFENAMGELP